MPEESKLGRAELERSRTLSDAEILNKGGEYDEAGVLQVPKDYKLSNTEGGITSKDLVESHYSVVEKIIDLLEKVDGARPKVEGYPFGKTGEELLNLGIQGASKDEKRIYSIDRKRYISFFITHDGKMAVTLEEKGREQLFSWTVGASHGEEKLKLITYNLNKKPAW